MTPQAEIWVPKGVSEKDLENLLEPIGGRIDKFQESKPIPVKEIMVAFLKESHPSLEFDPSPSYPQIFSKLRVLPSDEQEKLLVDFYSQKGEAFPNGAELGRFLARINNISWFQPKSPPDRKSLEELCQQVLSRLNLPNLTLRIIKEARGVARGTTWGATWEATWGADRCAAWDAARDAARNEAWGAACEAIRCAAWEVDRCAAWDAASGAAWGAACDAASDVTWGAAWEAASDVTWGAEWIVVKDLMPQRGYDKGNPFESLTEIYELGCWPIGTVPDQNGKKEFIIFVPPIKKPPKTTSFIRPY